MNSQNFLTKNQIENLTERNWAVSPKGQYLTLYREDFTNHAWHEICHELDIETNIESVDILYFGIQINH